MQPQWRYVPFVSTLLICSGLFMLLHGATPESVRPIGHGNTCEAVTAPGTPHSFSKTPGGDDFDSTDHGVGGAQPFLAASTERAADTDPLDQIAESDAKTWPSFRVSALRLRGPPSDGDDDARSHRWETGPVDSSFDATDDEDDGDDDADNDDGDGLATQVTPSASVSCALHTSSLLSRVEVHHPVSFASDVQSLRAPPQ